MPSLPRAIAVGLLALSAAGCELVFGLDDYAREGGAAGAGGDAAASTGDAASSGSRATGGGAGGDGSASSSTTSGPGAGGDDSGPATSSASGGGGGACPCVPDGWTLTEAYPVTDGSGPRTCSTGLLSDRAVEQPVVACHCSCTAVSGLGCSLACWEQADCNQGSPTLLPAANLGCAQIGKTVRSCAIAVVAGGVLAADPCEVVETSDITGTNVFDLCATSADGAGCGEAGVCGAPPAGGLWCVRGPAASRCPDGWDSLHDVELGGETACDCGCANNLSCDDATPFYLGNDCDFDQGVSTRTCTPTGDATTYYGNPPNLGGTCDPVAAELTGLLAGTTPETVCCRL